MQVLISGIFLYTNLFENTLFRNFGFIKKKYLFKLLKQLFISNFLYASQEWLITVTGCKSFYV